MDTPLERGETVAAVWQAIEWLPADLKIALLLRDVVGLSYTEIAESLEVTQSTVKWRIFKAREGVVLALARADVAPGGAVREMPRGRSPQPPKGRAVSPRSP